MDRQDKGIEMEDLKRAVEDRTTLEELKALKVRVDAAARALRAAVVE